jgi:pimeloyl-ACP methyl ester carboxylesterase
MKRYHSIRVVSVLIMGILLALGCSVKKPGVYRPEQVPTGQVMAGDVNITYRDYGEGYPLIMMMGLSGTMDTWDPNFISILSKGNRIIMFDYRGIGRTDHGSKPITMKQYAEDTSSLMDALKIARANVLGWSMGTYVAQEFTLAHPEKTNKVVLYAADFGGEKAIMPTREVINAMTTESGSSAGVMATLFPAKWLEDPRNQKYLKDVLGKYTDRPTGEEIKKQFEAWMSWQGTFDRLPQIQNMTLLISGASDVNTPWQNTPLIFDRLPNAWMIMIKDGGHGVMFQQPYQMANIINGFLE